MVQQKVEVRLKTGLQARPRRFVCTRSKPVYVRCVS